MPDDFTVNELSRIINAQSEAMNRLSGAMDRMSGRLDALPDTIDRIYVRKDVAAEHARRVEVTLEGIRGDVAEVRGDVETMRNWARWLASGILLPIILSLMAFFSARGGIH